MPGPSLNPWPGPIPPRPIALCRIVDGAAVARVVPPTLTTDPREEDMFTRPVYKVGEGAATGTSTVMAE